MRGGREEATRRHLANVPRRPACDLRFFGSGEATASAAAITEAATADTAVGCVLCDLLTGRMPLPGGRIHGTSHWVVFHDLGPFGLGALAVAPSRHVVRTADLTDGEAAQLGGLLRAVAGIVTDLTDPVQVYTCQ
jgi:hypothetical protein